MQTIILLVGWLILLDAKLIICGASFRFFDLVFLSVSGKALQYQVKQDFFILMQYFTDFFYYFYYHAHDSATVRQNGRHLHPHPPRAPRPKPFQPCTMVKLETIHNLPKAIIQFLCNYSKQWLLLYSKDGCKFPWPYIQKERKTVSS